MASEMVYSRRMNSPGVRTSLGTVARRAEEGGGVNRQSNACRSCDASRVRRPSRVATDPEPVYAGVGLKGPVHRYTVSAER